VKKRPVVSVRVAWRWGGRGLCLRAGKTRSQKMLINRADRIGNQNLVTIKKRVNGFMG